MAPLSSLFHLTRASHLTTLAVVQARRITRDMSVAANPTHTGDRTPYPRQNLIPTTGTYPSGWLAGGWSSGVKKSNAKDLTLVVSSNPVTASAVFTLNAFAAAPVQVSKEIVRGSGVIRALVVNSGCANACTGDKGLEDAREVVNAVGRAVGGGEEEAGSLVMSTGVIGQHLNMDKILVGIEELAPRIEEGSHDAWLGAAEGIMTTDTFPKLRSQKYDALAGGSYSMAGWSKGAGMIHPNMATMLSAVFTDAPITKACLDAATRYAADRSFNAISIDGDTSTNDTFAVLANGAAKGVKEIDSLDSPAYLAFRKDLTEFAAELAKLIVRDGEGATKFVEINIKGATTFADARTLASTIATSPLVKTALYGRDANWGRIVCAVGYAPTKSPIDPSRVNLRLSSPALKTTLHLFKDGAPHEIDEAKAAEILEHEDLVLDVDVGLGKEEATMYTCDFSHGYISINADYRS
ncbi:hypothetical protein HKX48_006868 [Thoreauomyces humboldtii]|nr:hypothetical protein HKX48_006868 [Thoreauomyces humboldtii]